MLTALSTIVKVRSSVVPPPLYTPMLRRARETVLGNPSSTIFILSIILVLHHAVVVCFKVFCSFLKLF